jgi:Complex I intermediate-associated protein 30 (CIA30)
LFTDRVMGGVSNGTMVRETVAGRPAIRMRGDVSLENNGGFVRFGGRHDGLASRSYHSPGRNRAPVRAARKQQAMKPSSMRTE